MKLLHKLAKQVLPVRSEFAPGIPIERKIRKIPRVDSSKPQIWDISVQRHEAKRAGPHIDLRLVDKRGLAHSCAIPKGRLPDPGEKVLAIPQPTHTKEYAKRKGSFLVPKGYGEGSVLSSGLKKTEVVRSDGRVLRFNTYAGLRAKPDPFGIEKPGNQEYAIIKTPKGSLLTNTTITGKSGYRGTVSYQIPQPKPKYREINPDKVRFDDPNEVHQPKIDGAHVTAHLMANKPVRFFSHRPSQGEIGVIEHSHKLPNYRKLVVPPSLSGTILRGELYGSRKGRAIPAEQTGGLLNATVWKSRERQKELGKLKPVIFDVVRYKGRDMQDKPYRDKLKVLKEVQEKLPGLKLPPTVETENQKRRAFTRIQEGRDPLTEEGVISWRLDKSQPTKVKFRPDVDVEVVGVTKGKGKHEKRIGALKVKLPGKSALTNVGTGLSDRLREQIARNPDNYIGRVAKVQTQRVFASGKLRAPSFKEFHIEKGKQPDG